MRSGRNAFERGRSCCKLELAQQVYKLAKPAAEVEENLYLDKRAEIEDGI